MNTKTQGFYLTSIEFNDGSVVDLDRNSIMLLTGPNNCGKSRTLNEIIYHPVAASIKKVTKEIHSEFQGDFVSVLNDILPQQYIRPNALLFQQLLMQSQGNPRIFLTLLAQHQHLYRTVANAVMCHLSTLTRLLSFGVAPENINLVNVQPFAMANLNGLYENQEIADKVYNYTKSTFGKGVVMNHASLQDSDLYFMDRENDKPRFPQNTSEYARWFESIDKLNQQGDGVHSFSTILIAIFQRSTPLILLDEPEAFLHPPQIRKLAKIVASELPKDTQLLVATHSDDFVRGMMDFASERTSVLRMTRHRQDAREVNRLRKLTSDQISILWNDPLLRTSDILSSLFHQIAIIVEGDSDARFFRSMIDAIAGEHDQTLDLRFFHCGGKDKIHKIVTSLRAIGVLVICIVDIDILDDKAKFALLVSSFGGDASSFEKPHQEILEFVRQKKLAGSALAIKEEILRTFDAVEMTQPLGESISKKIIDLVKNKSSWSEVKQYGERFFTGGAPFNMYSHVRDEAKKIGIFINDVGELENYCKKFSNKRKGDWLADVINLELSIDDELKEARAFVSDLLSKCSALVI